MRKAALAVVGKNERIGFREKFVEKSQVALQNFFSRKGFEVAAHELLLTGDNAKLDCSIKRRIEFNPGRNAFLNEELFDRVASFVASENGKERGGGAHGGNIARNVGCAPETFLSARHAHDGNRSFRGDAFGVSEPVAVEHGVARNQNAGFFELSFIHWWHFRIRWRGKPL